MMRTPDRCGDAMVRDTNDDAQLSKSSCVNLSYFKDDFVQYFVRRPKRRPPLINRGYYSRTAALRGLLAQFMEAAAATGQPRQVVSLGAGYDTTWMHLKATGQAPEKWIEIDFRQVTARKAATMRSVEAISKLVDPEAIVDLDAGSISSEAYALQPADLRDTEQLKAALTAAGFSAEVPTLVLAECVLVYMEPQEAAAVVATVGKLLPTAAFIVYEQIKPHDAFGQQMLRNLKERGCPLKGLEATADLESHRRRFTEGGWARADARDMATVYRRHIDPADRHRASKLEIFDEFEEWDMIQEHYCIAIGIKDAAGSLDSFGFKEYPAVPTQPPGR